MGNNASDGNSQQDGSANSNSDHKQRAPVPAPRVTAQPPQRVHTMPQPPQVTRFQSVEPPVNPPPARIAYFEENPPPYCDWASYPATAPEIPLNRASAMRDLEVDRPSTDVNLLTQSPETRFVPQRPQLPEPLIPGLAPPPTSHSSVNPDPKPLPSYRSKMEEAAQSGNFINFLGDTIDVVEEAEASSKAVIFLDWEVEVKKIEKELKMPPKLPKDAAALFNDALRAKSQSKSKNHLVNNPYLSDVQFKVGKDQQIMYGHKLFLMSASSVFLNKLAQEDSMELPNIEPDTFILILKYCYTEEKKFELGNVFQLIAAAKHFQLSRFLCDASQFAHDYLNVDKVFNLLEASADAGYEKIKANCVKFITDNEAKVFNSKGFKEISLKTLMCTFKHCDFEAGKRAEIVQKFNNREATPQVSENVTGCKPKDSKVKATPNQKQKVAAAKIPEPNITTSFEVVGPPLKSSNETAVKEEFEFVDIIAKDDDVRRKVKFHGQTETRMTEFSRLDLACKRSILLHEIGFTCMIGMGAKEARIEVLLWEKNVPRSIHMRIWNIEPKKGIMNTRLFLSKNPLKIFIGQKFSIKVNFDKTISCMHLNVQSSSNSEFFEIRKDIDKNYFNCVSYLVAQPMTN